MHLLSLFYEEAEKLYLFRYLSPALDDSNVGRMDVSACSFGLDVG